MQEGKYIARKATLLVILSAHAPPTGTSEEDIRRIQTVFLFLLADKKMYQCWKTK